MDISVATKHGQFATSVFYKPTLTYISTPLITPTPKPAFPVPSSSVYVDSALTMETFSYSPTGWLSSSQPGTTPTWLLSRQALKRVQQVSRLSALCPVPPSDNNRPIVSLLLPIPTTFWFVGAFRSNWHNILENSSSVGRTFCDRPRNCRLQNRPQPSQHACGGDSANTSRFHKARHLPSHRC